jgi:hypothetical protein
MKWPKAVVLTMILCGLTSIEVVAANRTTYHTPKIGGYRLDWCSIWGERCGSYVANRFCRYKNYNFMASEYAKDEDIGAMTPTRMIASGQICNQQLCDGFKHHLRSALPVDDLAGPAVTRPSAHRPSSASAPPPT